jgi:hypothetical protein
MAGQMPKFLWVVLSAIIGSVIYAVVIQFLGVPGPERGPGQVVLGIGILATMFGIPFLVGLTSGRDGADTKFARIVASGVGGALLTALTFLIWWFTYPEWWPSDEPIVFFAIFTMDVSLAVVGGVMSLIVKPSTR